MHLTDQKLTTLAIIYYLLLVLWTCAISDPLLFITVFYGTSPDSRRRSSYYNIPQGICRGATMMFQLFFGGYA